MANEKLYYISEGVVLESKVIVQQQSKRWLVVSHQGEIEEFDVEGMNSSAASGCVYARAFKAIYELGLKERNELAATVEHFVELRDHLPNVRQWVIEFEKLVHKTPRQNLNAVKREVYADGYYDGYRMAWLHDHDSKADHDEYASEQSEIESEKLYPSVKDGE